jgi:tripartite motif-containing protein 59
MPTLEETLTCPICLDLFDDPRLLSCSHTFCCKCLHTADKTRSVLTCPLCRYDVIEENLPVNRIVASLVEQYRQEAMHADRSIIIKAKCYDCKSYLTLDICYHCDTLLCRTCHNRHEIDWKTRENRTKFLLLCKGS